jgi:Uma2 family endonuclease
MMWIVGFGAQVKFVSPPEMVQQIAGLAREIANVYGEPVKLDLVTCLSNPEAPMAIRQRHAYFTPEKYLEIERISPIKHEYVQGQLVAMAGVSKAHVIIVGNLSVYLVNHLRGTGCISYANGMKVRLPDLNLFYYSDLAVTCDERDRASKEDFVLHPKLIIEALSDSTEAFDRGDKFADYKTIPEFEEYVLIHQKQVLVERRIAKYGDAGR